MQFDVLGELQVWSGSGELVKIPEVKVRGLLAALLVGQGGPVSAERLIDHLWEDRPPVNPTGALQTKVWQLRRALNRAEPGAQELVRFQPPGYVLAVEPDAVDAGRFEAELQRAHEIRGARERADAIAAALKLWRADPYAEFGDRPLIHPMVARLQERRLWALEELAEARLELGEHDLICAELNDLVAQHPLRERLRGIQMRALYRAGRQDEALAGYEDLRRGLAEELGVDPSPRLSALHQAILRHSPALHALDAPAAPAARPRTELPDPLSELIGRDGAISDVCALLRGGRLVTLTGPGGVGKTRVAIEAARRVRESYPDGVHLIELGGERERLAEFVLALLDIREDAALGLIPASGPAEAVERLGAALRGRHTLLVLDNCEHVIDEVAALAKALLHSASGVSILATSRERLRLDGERTYAVPPLPEREAVELFAARAAAARPGFALDDDNAEAIAVLCARLDGLPLAVELIAARAASMDPRELLSRLDDRFRLLAHGNRDAPRRHQSLQATLDWSWNLLPEPERMLLRRLPVHAGGCTLDAAEAVCAGDGIAPGEVLDLLGALVERNLVVAVPGAGSTRYRMLESIMAYGLDRLREAGETAALRNRHLDFHLRLAERAEPHLYGGGQREWLARLDIEAANLRRAADEAVRNRPVIALRLANSLMWYRLLRGRVREAQRSLATALDAAGGDAPRELIARATAWHTGIALMQGDTEDHIGRIGAAVRLFDGAGDPPGRARALWFLGHALSNVADAPMGDELVRDALAGFKELGDRWGIAAALSTQALRALTHGDLSAAAGLAGESAALFGELGDRWGHLRATFTLSTVAEIDGDYERAAHMHHDGLRMARELGLWTEVSERLSGLGRIAMLLGNHAEARELHQQALRLASGQGFTPGEIFAEIGLALGARREGRLAAAEEHLQRILDRDPRQAFEPAAVYALVLAELGFVAEQRGDAERALAMHRASLTVANRQRDPRAVALALEGLAGAAATARNHRLAARLLGAATATRLGAGAPLPWGERADVDRITRVAQEALGTEAFDAEFAAGDRNNREIRASGSGA